MTAVGFWMWMSTEAVSPQTHSAGPCEGVPTTPSSLEAYGLKMNGLLLPTLNQSTISTTFDCWEHVWIEHVSGTSDC